MSYNPEGVVEADGKMRAVFTSNENEKEEGMKMGDIAGLLALMQGNKNLDLPGLLALCKERGYDRSFGGEGSFMFVFLLFFLLVGGGWNGLGLRNQEAFNNCACGRTQELIALSDRIAAAKDASTSGFFQLDTKLCSSIAETIGAVRNQGDRVSTAVNAVSTQLASCCCDLKSRLTEVQGHVDGLYNHTTLMQERNVNAMQGMETRLSGQIKDLSCQIDNRFTNLELERLRRENAELKNNAFGNYIADRSIEKVENFMIQHYTPTRTA